MWGKAAADGTIPKLAAMMDRQPMGLLGVSACNDREEWKYFIAVSSSLPATEDLEEYEVPTSTWAIFSGSGTTYHSGLGLWSSQNGFPHPDMNTQTSRISKSLPKPGSPKCPV